MEMENQAFEDKNFEDTSNDAPTGGADLSPAHGVPSSDGENIEALLGESLSDLLDTNRWREGADLVQLYAELQETVTDAARQSNRTRAPIRQMLTKSLRDGAKAGRLPTAAGLYRLTTDDIAWVHSHLLFNGGVEACDGTVVTHDSLLLTAAQIGVSLVAYNGSSGTWVKRVYRRDLRGAFSDPVEEAIRLLNRRNIRLDSDSEENGGGRDPISRLMRRGLMEYAERVFLLERSSAPWRMGHGNPISTLFQAPASSPLLRGAFSEVSRRLILALRGLIAHEKFVFVASSVSDRTARTFGDALGPMEYAILDDASQMFDTERLETPYGSPEDRKLFRDFAREAGSAIVRGIFRVASYSPAHVFYAHRDHAHSAAAIAMADSVLQMHRGFPMLIDLADLTCRTAFDAASFGATVQNAYAAAGQPIRYLSERETRSR